MIALIVEINIKPGFKEQFMASMLGDARGSNNDEPGCLRFDVLQDNEDENKLHLFEVYEDEAALDAHRNAPHFIKWREECADWFATENIRKIATPVYPAPEQWEKAASGGLNIAHPLYYKGRVRHPPDFVDHALCGATSNLPLQYPSEPADERIHLHLA